MEDIRNRFPTVLYREHALARLLERGITSVIIEEAIFSKEAKIIEQEPADPRGPRCLVLGWWDDRQPLHVLVGLGIGTIPFCVITAWDPSADTEDRWSPDFRTRVARS